jgi:nicotinamidase-related amidase
MSDELILDPADTTMLVMDYQVGLLHRLPDAQALLDRVNSAITNVRANGAHVGWVRVAFTAAEFDAIPPSSTMARMAGPERRAALASDAPTSQIHPSLTPQPHDITVRKTRVGAFTTTDLDEQLRARKSSTLILSGISTSGVVLSTVREAMDRDYRIIVLENATADPDPDTHAFLIHTVFPRHASVIAVDDLKDMWA